MNSKLTHKGTVQLETDRLLLRRLIPEEAQKVYNNWTSDEEVAKYMRWNRHSSVEDTTNWLKESEENAKRPTFYDWGIIHKPTNEPIGSIGAFANDSELGRYEVGYALSRKYWGMGYTTEALKCIIDFLSNEVGIKMFVARHAHENPASGAVMRHVGFTYVKDGLYISFDGMRNYPSKIYYLDFVD